MSKKPEPSEAEATVDSENSNLSPFYFPEHNLTIQAVDRQEAEKLLPGVLEDRKVTEEDSNND